MQEGLHTIQDPHDQLKQLEKKQEFFIGIDSDGCAFDTMEIKHKECFCPNTIKYFGLQKIAKYARETWDFVNLYSQTRGCNRFLGILRVYDLLKTRKQVIERGAVLANLLPLREWTQLETKLGTETLEAYMKQRDDGILATVLAWSKAVNQSIEEMVFGIPPFPLMRESLEAVTVSADVLVISQTPLAAITREWQENDIYQYVRLVAGQEYGTKTEHLLFAAKGKYDDDKILMIGDAPGDLQAAQSVNALFYPIIPGQEEQSWDRFYNEARNRFFAGTYKGEYETELISEFNQALPVTPWWEK
ncbi:MAG: HAD family hydrolase [Spirochaetales bacterium]|nr:HAD family hydrolase [Spirochaetales bacterium]